MDNKQNDHLVKQGVTLKKAKAKTKATTSRAMGSNDALLDAILAKPDDDAPRLAYAEFLTSHGDSRGEFIQLQCALGNVIHMGGTSDHPTKPVSNAAELISRAEKLLKQSRGGWLEDTKLKAVLWSRGFPLQGDSEAGEFIANARYDRIPLAGITVHWDKKSVEAIFDRQRHPTISRYELGVGFGPKILQVLTAPVFANATRFSLRRWEPAPTNPKGLDALSRASFPALEEFAAPAELLAALDHAKCPKLRTFRVEHDSNLEPAAATNVWRQLRRLEIRVKRAEGWSGLRAATSLEVIEFWRPEQLTVEDAQVLVDAAPPSLETLIGTFIVEPTHFANGGCSNALVDENVMAILEKRFTLKPKQV